MSGSFSGGGGWEPYDTPGSDGGNGGNLPAPLSQFQINQLAQEALQAGDDASSCLSLTYNPPLASLAKSRAFADRNSDFLNVLDYGVIGDGVSSSFKITVSSGSPTVLNVAGAAFNSADVGKCLFVNGIGAPACVVTGSIAPASASFTASISGVVMTVTDVASGTIAIGSTLGGGGVAAGITVTAAADGDTIGGVGVYYISSSQNIASTPALTAAYGVLTVTGVVSGSLPTGQYLAGANVASNTKVVSLGTGAGGIGTYYVNISQTTSSTAITAPSTSIATTVLAVNSPTQIVMANAATTFVSASTQTVTWGTEDAANINAFLSVVAKFAVSIAGGGNLTVLFPRRIYIVKSASLNFTNFANVNVIGNFATFYGATNGVCVIDAMGAYGCKFSDFTIIGDRALPPNVGWQIGRYLASGRAFGLNCGRDINITGYFSLTGFYNLGSETSEWTRISLTNNYPGGLAGINDGCYHFGLTSQYLTFTLPANVSFTFSVNLFIECRFTVFGAGANALWLSSMGGHRFIRCYTYTQQYAYVIYAGNGNRCSDCELDFSNEGNMTDILYIADDGSHYTSFNGLRIRMHAQSASNSIFKCDASWTALKIYGLDLFTDGIPTSGDVFDNLTPWQITGDLTFVSPVVWVSPTGGFTGFVTQGTTRTYYGGFPQLQVAGGVLGANAYFAIGGTANGTQALALGYSTYADTYGKVTFGNGKFSTNGDAQSARTVMRGLTSSTAATRISAAGGTISNTTIINPRFNSAFMVTAKLIARDYVTGDAAIWTAGPFLMTCGANGSTVSLKGSPVFAAGSNTGGGSLASAPLPTVVADTVSGGLNITVQATGTNLVHWVCEVTTVEVL